MRLNLVRFTFFWVYLALIGCNAYDLEDTIQRGMEEMEWKCNHGSSEYFFKGLFGQDSICGFDNEGGYKTNFAKGNGFITLNPTFNSTEIQTQDSKSYITFGVFKVAEGGHPIEEEIRVNAQPMKFGTPLDSMVRAFIVNGVHPVRGKVTNSVSNEGFEIILYKLYRNPNLNPDHWAISCTSAFGKQPVDSYVNILDVHLQQNGDYVEGYVHLVFKCALYYDNAGKLTGDFVRDLSGEFYIPIKYKR